MIKPLEKNAKLEDLFNKVNELIEAHNELLSKLNNHTHEVTREYADTSIARCYD